MSRIGKLPVVIPDGVTVKVEGRHLEASGPKGNLELKLPKAVSVEQADNTITVSPKDSETGAAQYGLARTLIDNLVKGVAEGFSKTLEINGVGYRAQVSGQKLTLQLGFSHPIEYDLPAGIEAKVEASNLSVSGIDKQLVGQVAAEIRSFRPPEPYKGKGIKYADEQIRRKAGKTVAK
jgi:large subunit ribosomal protein L6